MNYLIYILILLGSLLMITNIIRYILFIHKLKEIKDSRNDKNKKWKTLALFLLIFFLLGYVGVAVSRQAGLLISGILFGGSIFVAIILTLMFHLVNSEKENCLAMTETLIGMIESRDPNLNGHSHYVQHLTMCFYRHLPAEIRKSLNASLLEYAALLHDVGKLGIPETILNKPGKLTDEEWEIMKQHPKLGVEFMKPLYFFRTITPWILYHHERVDGKGYYKIPKEQIPLESRIIAVCDTYSAITMRRSYKDAMHHEVAMSIINECAGTQLDSSLVEYFNKIPKAELEECIPNVHGF